MTLIDTNILIELFKGNSEVLHELETIPPQNIALSAVTAVELSTPLFTFNTKDFRFIDRLQLYTSPVAT